MNDIPHKLILEVKNEPWVTTTQYLYVKVLQFLSQKKYCFVTVKGRTFLGIFESEKVENVEILSKFR